MKHEFASPAWIEDARESLQATVAELGALLDGVRFGVCETYTDPPLHLRREGSDEISWYFVIDGPTAEVGEGMRTDVDHAITADYTVAIPYAKQPAIEQHRTFAALKVPDELRRQLMAFHDHMASVTR